MITDLETVCFFIWLDDGAYMMEKPFLRMSPQEIIQFQSKWNSVWKDPSQVAVLADMARKLFPILKKAKPGETLDISGRKFDFDKLREEII